MNNVEAARPEDRPAILRVLQEAGLPTEDLADARSVDFLVVREKAIVGVVGIERAGAHALLRSLAVTETGRGRGLGRSLVEAAHELAASSGIAALHLLTTSADGFFDRCGYARLDRNDAPEEIRRTRQFSSLCPASSVLMVKRLEPRHS